MAIRCKMHLENDIGMAQGSAKAIFSCQYDPKIIEEDGGFQKAAPWGQTEHIVDNPKAIEQLVIGGYYYFDITPVPATA
jgi:hypothetical protein